MYKLSLFDRDFSGVTRMSSSRHTHKDSRQKNQTTNPKTGARPINTYTLDRWPRLVATCFQPLQLTFCSLKCNRVAHISPFAVFCATEPCLLLRCVSPGIYRRHIGGHISVERRRRCRGQRDPRGGFLSSARARRAQVRGRHRDHADFLGECLIAHHDDHTVARGVLVLVCLLCSCNTCSK